MQIPRGLPGFPLLQAAGEHSSSHSQPFRPTAAPSSSLQHKTEISQASLTSQRPETLLIEGKTQINISNVLGGLQESHYFQLTLENLPRSLALLWISG